MTLPSSGTLDYNSIRAEFGSPSSNVYLSLYYRGGPYTYNIPVNSNIPTGSSSQISVSNFYSTAGKGPFLQFSGGQYNTGGKAPILYSGAGGPSLPSISDTSLQVSSTTYNIYKYYGISTTSTSMFISGTPNANLTSAPTWSQRNFYHYTPSGSLHSQFRTGWSAGQGQVPNLLGASGQQPSTSPQNAPFPGAPSTWLYSGSAGYPATGANYFSDRVLSGPPGPNPGPDPNWVIGNPTSLNQNTIVKAY